MANTPQGHRQFNTQESSPLCSVLLHLEEEEHTEVKLKFKKKKRKGTSLSIMCIVVPSYHLTGSCRLFGQQTSNNPGVVVVCGWGGWRSGCAPICALKVRIDKHLQSRKRRHYANGSQAVNLNQGVFSPGLPQGLFTSFASADNSLSGGSKYRHKALPLLLSEALLRSGSIRSHCPRRSLLAHSPSPSPPLQWS